MREAKVICDRCGAEINGDTISNIWIVPHVAQDKVRGFMANGKPIKPVKVYAEEVDLCDECTEKVSKLIFGGGENE